MTKDISIYNSLSPVEQTELKQIADEVRFLSQKTAEISYRTGECLSRARDLFKHNKNGGFEEWLENEFGESRRSAYRYISFYESIGKSTVTRVSQLEGISQRNLFLLSAPSMPEGSLEAAVEAKENGETVTEKWIKKYKEDEAKIAELQAENIRLKEDKKTPEPANLDNLIPALKEMLDDGLIMPAMARNLSTMTNDGQRAWVTIHTQKMSAERQLSERNLRIKELESRPEPEPTIIEKIIEVMPEGSEQKIKDAETKIKQADKILKSMAALQAKKEEVEAKAESLNSERNELERKIKALEAKEQTKTPGAIDDSRSIKLARIVKELDWIFPDILKEAELSGGYMPKSKEEIGEIIRRWSQLLSQIDGQSVIDI